MTSVLVVDDSRVDRRLVGGLLAKHPGFVVHYAANGVEALDAIQREPTDIVVTDLIMPEMNGLELVARIRQSFPLVPVILMTSQGSEELAVQALQQGAASYVPKRALRHKLGETVRRVLGVASHQRSQTRLMGSMIRSESAFVLENDSSLFPPLVTYIQDGIGQLGLADQAERTRIGIAVEEALANALYHGNLQVGSALRDVDPDGYYKLVARRQEEPPYRDRRIYVEARLSRQQAAIVVRDEGEGFDPSQLPDPTDPANLERASGRGVLLMRTFMDEVIYNAVGNEVTLVKRGRPSP